MPVTSVGARPTTVRSRSARVWSPTCETSRTLMRETRTLEGRNSSRSEKSCDQEKLLRLTSSCAAFKVSCCSGVMFWLISCACFSNSARCARIACTCRSDSAVSALTARYCASMRTSAARETRETATATVHGSARLRNGSEARLSLAITCSFAFRRDGGAGGAVGRRHRRLKDNALRRQKAKVKRQKKNRLRD